MSIGGIPTSSDISLMVENKKVAVVQSYAVKTTRSSLSIEAFGEEEPVATSAGRIRHVIELTRLYATDEALKDGINFYQLTDFSLVICKPDKKIVYSGCQWDSIAENAALGGTVAERITLVATKRIETGV